ncbi:MAG: hypothetical protein AAGH19_00195 [Pseudomonadota bacterium]
MMRRPLIRHDFRVLALMLLAALIAGCVPPKKEKDLDSTLLKYEQMVRWSQWDAAATMIDPEYLEENPITNLDMERLRLFRVTNYTLRSAAPLGEGNDFTQVVEIRMFNKTQAREKVIVDQQLWRYNEESEVWLLHSGLPNVLQRY